MIRRLSARLLLVFAIGGLGLPIGSATASASPTQDFGAIAYSVSAGVAASNVGYSKSEAVAAAEEACRAQGGDLGCQTVAFVRNGYIALAKEATNNAKWGWTWATSRSDADAGALHYCGLSCTVIKRESTAGAGLTQLAIGGSISPLRGNWSVGGFGRGEGDHSIGTRDEWAVDLYSDDPAVFPMKPGKVVFATYDDRLLGNPPDKCTQAHPCYGWTVVVDHGNGLSSVYTHLLEGSLPALGSDVSVDTRIGTMSSSGCVECGVHLHVSMRSGSIANSDPLYAPGLVSVRTPWIKGG